MRNGAVRRGAALGLAGMLAGAIFAPGHSQGPPFPDFASLYGRIDAGGLNLDPTVQPVVAFVRGTGCGSGVTKVAPADADTPPADAGKTVYTLLVAADGDGPAQRPGCGRPSDPISLWFPASGRFALNAGVFQPGTQRLDVSAGTLLSYRLTAPGISSDGIP
ncbi:MAG: hypothetical protein HYX53_01195 [Chloroflexi bacterium]|nr:hypothetical protein [Chloroflexota bacterium]